MTGLATSLRYSQEITDQLFHRHDFAMPTAALEGHVIVDYGLKLGDVREK
jgi:hypothetical protein